MKRSVAIGLFVLVGLSVLGVAGCGGNDKSDCEEKVRVYVRAVAHADRGGTVWYYISGIGMDKKGFYINASVSKEGKVNSSLCPEQSLVLTAAFNPGQETEENTRTLTYDEALSGAESIETYQRGQGEHIPQDINYIYTWHPTFDLSGL